jgi:hypothetical protein
MSREARLHLKTKTGRGANHMTRSRHSIISALACVAVFAASQLALTACYPANATQNHSNTTERYQFVGFSLDLVTGDAGVLGMTQTCEATFASSRMCTTQEIIETASLPELTPGDAWVRPSFRGFTEFNSSPWALDISGRNGPPSDLTCRGWTSLADRGFTVTGDGGFGPSQDCDVARPVACCAKR